MAQLTLEQYKTLLEGKLARIFEEGIGRTQHSGREHVGIVEGVREVRDSGRVVFKFAHSRYTNYFGGRWTLQLFTGERFKHDA